MKNFLLLAFWTVLFSGIALFLGFSSWWGGIVGFLLLGLITWILHSPWGLYHQAFGLYRDKKYTEAIAYWHRAAEKGHVASQFQLGCCFRDGKGVLQDDTQALYWWLKAAAQGDTMAQFNVGHSYFNGLGVEQDYNEAVYWFGLAARKGDAKAQFYLNASLVALEEARLG
jgi:TPR repeat protein, SEL1 subfamily